MAGFLYITSGETKIPDECTRLTRQIRHLQEELARLAMPPEKYESAPQQSVRRSTTAARILKLRTRRNEIFGKGIFGEPAWDMLLQLYDAQLEGRTEYVTGLCAASGVPPSTVLRWIRCLLERRWIERKLDDHEKHRLALSLTPEGRDAMERIFSQPEFTGGL